MSRLRNPLATSSRWAGSATRPRHSACATSTVPPGRARRSAVLDVLDDRLGVGVDEDDVVGVLVHARQHVGGAAGDQAHPVRGDAGLEEVGPRVLLVVDLVVDRGERRAGRAAEQPDTGHPGTGADLEDVPGAGRRREHGALRADRGRDGVDARVRGTAGAPSIRRRSPQRSRRRISSSDSLSVTAQLQLVVSQPRAVPGMVWGCPAEGYSDWMFGLTFEKLLIIGIIAVFLLGPEKLPHYAAQFGRLVRQLRDMANGAKDRMRDEMGPEFDDLDWKKLDPRQYDPRRIIREALIDDGTDAIARRRSSRRPCPARGRTPTAPTCSANAPSRTRSRPPNRPRSTPRPPSFPCPANSFPIRSLRIRRTFCPFRPCGAYSARIGRISPSNS